MKKYFIGNLCLFLLVACNGVEIKKKDIPVTPMSSPVKFYSKTTKDTSFEFVSTPGNLDRNKKYPVVYLIDANLYFDVMTAAFKRYSEVGLLPEAILVGVGYKDFQTMDSLRDRDYTYPAAIPEYEMSASGNAKNFLALIENEIVPYIDSNYPCDMNKRVLSGHSLGGYFTLFALQQALINNKTIFSSYIAASPSTDYNHNYILKEFEKLKPQSEKINCYVTFGGLEDEQEDTSVLKCPIVLENLKHSLKENCRVNYKGDMYSSLDHMDMALPTFIKGIQLCLMSEGH
jgi:predicted alpha/beta superfamily hydrolase